MVMKQYPNDLILLLIGKLLSERCRGDDMVPNVPIPGLPPDSVDANVLGLDVFINCSEPGCSWTSGRSPPVSWGSRCRGYDMVMIFQ